MKTNITKDRFCVINEIRKKYFKIKKKLTELQALDAFKTVIYYRISMRI